jgi:lysophospholipase L1-like esterase
MSALRAVPARDETCREVLRASVGGPRIRLRLSNVMSPTPLSLAAITVGLRRTHAELVGPPKRLTVAGATTTVIPVGEHVTTDPVALPVEPGTDVAVSFAVTGTARLSEHLVGAATGWCTGPGSGNRTTDPTGAAFGTASREGLVLEALEVETATRRADGILAVGDSLTDPPLPPDTYQRWTDVVAAAGRPIANVAIGGNRIILKGGYGRTLTERFADDLLDRPGAGTLILFAGTNDVSTGITAAKLTSRLNELIRQAKARGLRVVLVTLAPAWKRSPPKEQVRQEVNAWIRTTPYADLRVDADRLLRDPARPTHLLPAYDFGDGLHLSVAGHRVLGQAILTTLAG